MPCPPLSPGREYYISDGPDVRVTVSNPNQSRSESTVAVNPTNARNLICASKKFIQPHVYHFTVSTSYSNDGGATWTESELALQPGWDGMTDPDLTFDADGNAYLMIEPLVFGASDISGQGMYVTKSTDGGATWGTPVQLHTDTADDKQWIEADTSPTSPYRGNVYAIWGANTPLRFSRSSDQGATWRGFGWWPSGTNVTGESSFAPAIALSDDGTIHISWHIPNTTEIKYTRSTDGGNSFSPVYTVVSGVYSLGNYIPNVGGFPQFPNATFRVMTMATSCVAAGDKLIIAWADYREGMSRIYYRMASNNGATWLGPNNGQPLLTAGYVRPDVQHFHPQLATADDGAVGCAFYEYGRKPQHLLIDTCIAYSCSDGDAFSAALTITDQPWDPAVNAPWSHGNPATTFIGDYFGIAGGPRTFAVVWTDTRTGVQELFFDGVRVRNRPIRNVIDLPEEVLEIIAGVIQDGGGLVLVDSRIIRIPPWDPWIDVVRQIVARDVIANRQPGEQDAVSALRQTFAPAVQKTEEKTGAAQSTEKGAGARREEKTAPAQREEKGGGPAAKS